MTRRLLRDGQIVVDDWRYAGESDGNPAAELDKAAGFDGAAAPDGAAGLDGAAAIGGAAGLDGASSPSPAAGLIVSFDQWQTGRDAWLARGARVGVVLLPAHPVEALAPDLPRLSLIAADFPGPSEGRGYSQARLLRERWNFSGELRATGYVRRDQLFFLARCGFNSFELPEEELEFAQAALSTFSKAYQPSNDAGLPLKLQRR